MEDGVLWPSHAGKLAFFTGLPGIVFVCRVLSLGLFLTDVFLFVHVFVDDLLLTSLFLLTGCFLWGCFLLSLGVSY